MGKSSAAVKQFVGKPSIAADLCNGIVFGGRKVVNPNDLEPVSGESEFLITDKNGKKKVVQRFRDVTLKWKNGSLLTIIACENQSYVDYIMPVRTMIYDGLTYQEQADLKWDKKGKVSVSSDEFLSHFRREDKLTPVITLVLYYDAKEWDGSLDLHGLLDMGDDKETVETMKKYIPNYNINLVDVNTVDEEKFQTDLRVVFGALKRKGDKRAMEKYMTDNKEFENMDEETYDALGVMLEEEEWIERFKKTGGKRNMCKAFQDIREESYLKGRDFGSMEKLKEIATAMFQKGFAVKMIVELTGASEEVIADIVKKLQEEMK